MVILIVSQFLIPELGLVLYAEKKYGKFQCPILLAYGNSPLPNGNLHARQTLAMNLSQIKKFSVHKRLDTDTRDVLKSMPKKMQH